MGATVVHIPDGYLSPQTCAAGYALAVPAWAVATRRVRKVVRDRHVPTLALLAAVCFLVMMFNIPVPDGTTAHAVGGGLVAILLGPWAAVIAVSVALLFQALLFGDGGVLAYGVNVVNMAVAMPFAAYGMYRLVAGRTPITSGRRVLAAAAGGYLGINVSALLTGVELGIQPDLFHTPAGAPLYSPYHLAQAVPVMMLAHLAVAGPVEAALTGGVVAYLQRTNVPLLRVNARSCAPADPGRAGRRRVRPLTAAALATGAMALLTPLGLLAPGGAFGEDAATDLDTGRLGLSAVPAGLNRYNGFWRHSLLDGYGLAGGRQPAVGYVLSAAIGVLVVGVVVYLLTTMVALVTGRGRPGPRPDGAAVSLGRPDAGGGSLAGPAPTGLTAATGPTGPTGPTAPTARIESA